MTNPAISTLTTPTNPDLSAASRLVYLHREINLITSIKAGYQASLDQINEELAKRLQMSKDLQIEIFEEEGKITKLTMGGNIRKIKSTSKPQPVDVCPDDITKFLDALDEKDKAIFVANLLRKV